MAFRNPFVLTRGSPSGDSVSPGYENSPFGPDDPAAIPRWLPRPASVSDRSTSVYTGTETDTPSRATPARDFVDLTTDEDPQVAQGETTRISPIPASGGGHNWGARSGSARSEARRVAASRSKSVGEVRLRGAGWGGDSVPAQATPVVNQHTEPSSRASGTITNASTAYHIENIYSLITELQQGREAHDTRFAANENTVRSIREEFSAKINDAESRIEGIGKQLLSRMDEAEGQRRREREEDVKTRVQEEKNQIFRHGLLLGVLHQQQGFGLVRQNAEPYGVGSPTSYQYEVAPSDTSQHTHSSQGSPRHEGRSPRLSGYEDPRMSKCSRGKRPISNNLLRKTRRHSAASSRNHTPRSTPTVSEYDTLASNSPGKGVIETAHSIKSERSLYSNSARPSQQHSPSPKRETSSAVPASSPIYH